MEIKHGVELISFGSMSSGNSAYFRSKSINKEFGGESAFVKIIDYLTYSMIWLLETLVFGCKRGIEDKVVVHSHQD